jgi:hypothetical protein
MSHNKCLVINFDKNLEIKPIDNEKKIRKFNRTKNIRS